jgi:O-methyltransferase
MVQHLPEWIAKTRFDFDRWRELWTAQNPANDRADLARLLMFVENARILEQDGIVGSLAELGVYKGTTAKLLHELMPARTLWLFDTFEGFDARDLAHERHGATDGFRFDDTSLEAVLRHVGGADRVRACKGRFPDTAAEVPAGERFALVHLDADLNKPTADALAFFYPRMSPGGFIVLHDYGSGAWPGIAEAVDAFFQDKPEGIVRIPDKSGTAIVRVLKTARIIA